MKNVFTRQTNCLFVVVADVAERFETFAR